MKTVGPSTNTNIARIAASTMLMFDRYWMPLATPVTADAMNASVSSATIATSSITPAVSSQPVTSKPEPICSAPRPSDAAVPNRVANRARMSMTLPSGPSARRPSSGMNAELMSCLRPLRKVPYAMARPTTA